MMQKKESKESFCSRSACTKLYFSSKTVKSPRKTEKMETPPTRITIVASLSSSDFG